MLKYYNRTNILEPKHDILKTVEYIQGKGMF